MRVLRKTIQSVCSHPVCGRVIQYNPCFLFHVLQFLVHRIPLHIGNHGRTGIICLRRFIEPINQCPHFFKRACHVLFLQFGNRCKAEHKLAHTIRCKFNSDPCVRSVTDHFLYFTHTKLSVLHMISGLIHANVSRWTTVFGYWVADPERYGVAEFDSTGRVLSIEEKPEQPRSNYAVVGLYFYPNKVVRVAKGIKPSARGELEITSVNQAFLEDGELNVQLMGRGFAWLDTGTHDSLAEASTFIEVIEKRQGLKVACLESIAYEQGWLGDDDIQRIAQPMAKNQYGQYLLKLIKN